MKLNNEDIEIYDSSMGFNTGIAFTLSIYSKNKEELEQLKQEILRRWNIVEKLEAILKTRCVEKNPECIFCKANPLLQQILKEKRND